ncbi:OLC1v1022293C2 [Oldenlandia corymbosa var. corymbosa]|uniref:protein-serine/threonine phosphatase n=1 Tax=Oldenlandia corymbosa var. corymbosa TaxID=529605 RepID=A0AAV1BXJ3_OLDCO|nr:OLC1v1022293C2 [Oldenlandia corymbosa var. corymbosa]
MLQTDVVGGKDLFSVSSAAMELPSATGDQPPSKSAESSVSDEIPRSESALSCSTCTQTAATFMDSPGRIPRFLPIVRSGSDTATGPRRFNEDEHLCIDNLSDYLSPELKWPVPCSMYAVFDGHGGSGASTYLKDNALRILLQYLPKKGDNDDELFLEELENSLPTAFLAADQALADDISVSSCCGTTAIIALVVGSHLLIANAGDCRAVLCHKGDAIQLSQDHRPSDDVERKRVEDLGGSIQFGYLNGELAVTRALGDWNMKRCHGSKSPLTAEPEVHRITLTEDDEFLIIGSDGIWDAVSNQDAVDLVLRELRQHGDPQKCARELVDHVLQTDAHDNLTAVVVSFSCPEQFNPPPSKKPRFRIKSKRSDGSSKDVAEGEIGTNIAQETVKEVCD